MEGIIPLVIWAFWIFLRAAAFCAGVFGIRILLGTHQWQRQ